MNAQPVTTAEKIRAFPWYYTGQAANVALILLTWFGSVLPLYFNALGMTKSQIGVILAIPWFASLLSLLVSKWVLSRGVKRVFLWGYGVRAAITAGLLAAPFILDRAGLTLTVLWVGAVSLGFSISRAVAETGFLSWSNEFIPNHLRGKTDAVNAILCGVASLVVYLLAALVLRLIPGRDGYWLLILASLPFAVGSLLAFRMVPGGRPVRVEAESSGTGAAFRAVLGDRNFRQYEIALGFYNLAIWGLVFLPLYLQGSIGLGADRVLLLSACYWLGILSSSYLWGWSADRFGSKPVLLSGLLLIGAIPPLFFLLPRGAGGGLGAVMALYIYYGIANQGVLAGSSRYFYVGAIPPTTRNPAYYAVHYAWGGLCAGVGPLWAGRLLDACRGIEWSWRGLHVDQFAPLFAASLVLFLAGAFVMRRLRKDGAVQPREFMTMFLQGNPILAFHSMIRYRFAGDEAGRLSTTRRMGDAENPLSAAELLEAVTDPSFNVRYEAILAMARMPAQPALLDALCAVLDSKEPDLCVAAGWALGRIGDRRAVPALRRALASEYALLRSRSARSLANLGDRGAVPLLRTLFRTEPHDGIRVAYAAALGSLRATEAMDEMTALLDRAPAGNLRCEVALALARLVGADGHFIRLWRATREDFGTGCAAAVLACSRRLRQLLPGRPDLYADLAEADRAFADQNIARAAPALARFVRGLPLDRFKPEVRSLLTQCAARLEAGTPDADRLLLSISGLHAALAELWRQREASS